MYQYTLATLLFTAIAIIVTGWWWARTAARLKKQGGLGAVQVIRDPEGAAKRRAAWKDAGLLSLVDVDVPSTPASTDGAPCKSSTLGAPRAQHPPPCLLSLGDYFASLDPQGPVSWERLLVSIADRFGLTAALPLALFLPNAWRTEAAAGGLLASFPSCAASTLVTKAVSTLDLAAFAQTVHLYHSSVAQRKATAGSVAAAAGAALTKLPTPGSKGKGGGSRDGMSAGNGTAAGRAAEAQLAAPTGPLDLLLRGGSADLAAVLATALSAAGAGSAAHTGSSVGTAENPGLLLDKRSLPALLGLSEDDMADACPAPAPAPVPVSPLLPGLHLGNGGLLLTHSRAGAAVCSLLAAVANRLVANALSGLPAAAAAAGKAPAPLFTVRLSPDGAPIASLEALLQALEHSGHSVRVVLSSNLTSFGIGLSVGGGEGRGTEDGGEGWQQVPLAYPLRCSGLWSPGHKGGCGDAITLVPHASVVLRVSGPQLTFDLEWCLNVRGGTFFLPYAYIQREWATGEACRVTHPLMPPEGASDGTGAGTADDRRRLARLITAASCVANLAAQSDRLLFGGYGHVGVCVDSVAAIQQAMCGRCTLFPLILGGEAKLRLMSLYRQARTAGWSYGDEAAELQAALAALPYDAVQEPRTAAAAARRALACLPAGSPFVGVAACRRSLLAALAAAEELCPQSATCDG